MRYAAILTVGLLVAGCAGTGGTMDTAQSTAERQHAATNDCMGAVNSSRCKFQHELQGAYPIGFAEDP
jgi:PBP1b-binding outer membrane lipoprotein LpoB